ncbi:MAG: hydroxymethylglutaryl-CoA lyase [Myxococcales bacterium]|nr:hydroxymethylglutaryl-CoA lyase [Myxococcales bacterium]USN50962.1 MAG: hydroxymethylglutaryl-CoA lyase [Myxococcales bacterium]
MITESLKNLPTSVKIMEVGPRDGLQNEKTIIDTEQKIQFIENLVDAGIKRIEVTAFVSPRWIPPLADQLEVVLGIKKKPGASYAALVPNAKGYERAVGTGKIDEISFVIAASDTHNQKNLNADTKAVLERYREVAYLATRDRIPFRVYLSCAFGCPYENKVSTRKIISLTKQMLELGAYEVALSDTIGIASPRDTMNILAQVLQVVKKEELALHMHDTRGMALANIWIALLMGIASFDSAVGGLGGCPYAPGASGNVATEDLVNMLNSVGIQTDISIESLVKVSQTMAVLLKKAPAAKMAAMCRS